MLRLLIGSNREEKEVISTSINFAVSSKNLAYTKSLPRLLDIKRNSSKLITLICINFCISEYTLVAVKEEKRSDMSYWLTTSLTVQIYRSFDAK